MILIIDAMKAVFKIKCGLANTPCNPAVSKCYFSI